MPNRRKFLRQSMAAATIPFWGKFENSEKFNDSFSQYIVVPMYFFATNWGFNGDLNAFCSAAKLAGYDGIEMWLPGSTEKKSQLLEAINKHGLKLGLLIGSGNSNFEENRAEFQFQITEALKLSPIYINCHSGKDYFTIDQAELIIKDTILPSEKAGIPIYHESHRGRICYTLPITVDLLKRIPAMQLTLDISHWCVVHESLLADQKESVALALSKTGHIHARVGHAEGPQVTDPRAPEWQEAFDAHIKWWDEVVNKRNKEGKPITILTEFGPPMYLPVVPYTKQPLANQWDINVFMLNFLRKRYLKN